MKKILKKIFFIVLILVITLIILSIILFSFNLYWYNKLIAAKNDLISTKNYTQRLYQAGYSYENGTTYSESGIKVYGDKSVNLIYEYQNSKEYGVDLPVVSKTYYTNNGTINVDIINNEFSIGEYLNYFSESLINYPIYSLKSEMDYAVEFPSKLKKCIELFARIAYQSYFSFVTENGKEYIVLKSYANDTWAYYFDRETMLIEKIMILDAFEDYENKWLVNEYFVFEKGNVTPEDVEIPDLSNYVQQVYIKEN